MAIRTLAAGYRFGYFDAVHVIYQIHEANSSAAATAIPFERNLRIVQELVRGFEELRGQLPLTPAERRALDRRLGRDYFWLLGYALLWQHGRRREALAAFRRGLWAWPWDLGRWKTYLLARLRTALAPQGAVASAPPGRAG
jgi:hypothetical protein